MRVVAFYSFKGGVGRTTALLNVAYCLARRGRKVVVADWDLHAPGLSLMEFLRPENEEKPTRGILDYLVDLRDQKDDPERVSIAEVLRETRLAAEAQGREEDPDGERPRMQGELFFIPAGNLADGVEQFAVRIKEAGLHDLSGFFKSVDPDDTRLVFKLFCEELRQTAVPWNLAESEGPPDYLLVDCRTGLTEIGDLLLGEATDFNVIVYGQDPQNLEGLKIALNARPRLPWQLQGNTLLLWSMEPPGQEWLKISQRKLKRELEGAVCQVDSLDVREAFPVEFKIPYHPELALTNVPIVHIYGNSELSRLCIRVTDELEMKCLWVDTLIEEQRRGPQLRSTSTPQRRAVETILEKPDERERLLRSAMASIALARQVSSFLFNPPSFDFAGCTLRDVVDPWPEDFNEDERKQFANLWAWSISLSMSDKKQMLRAAAQRGGDVFRQAQDVLLKERKDFLTEPGSHYWELMALSLAGALEWWLFAGPETRQSDTAQQLVWPLLRGQPIQGLDASHHPFFILLTVKSLHRSLTETREGTDYARLRSWLLDQDIDFPKHLMELTERGLDTREEAVSPELAAFVWSSEGDSLSEGGWAAGERDKVAWFDRAIEAYDKSLRLRPEDGFTLNNLGVALSDQAKTKTGEEADALFAQAGQKYDAALKIKPDFHEALYNWGNALSDQAKTKTGEEADALFAQAGQKYDAALKIKPDKHEALNNWGACMVEWARSKGIERAPELLDSAWDKCYSAESLVPGHGAYNLACICSLKRDEEGCRRWLDVSRLHRELPSRDDMGRDPDLENVRVAAWFDELLSEL